jgi:hypothetical protein
MSKAALHLHWITGADRVSTAFGRRISHTTFGETAARCQVMLLYLLQLVEKRRDSRIPIELRARPWARAHVDHHLVPGRPLLEAYGEVLLRQGTIQ